MAPSQDPEPSAGASTHKIAMKGFSLSARAKPSTSSPKPTSTLLGKRPRAALHHEDSDSEGEARVQHEVVTGFGAEGAIAHEEKKAQGPLVIAKMGNRDWRGEMKRKREQAMGKGKNLLPPEVQARMRGEGKNGPVVEKGNTGEGEPAWGLTVTKKVKVETNEVEEEMVNATVEESEVPVSKEKTDDELALEALMGVKSEKKGPALVIAAAEAQEEGPPLSETDAYRRAIASAPDVSTLEDYERVPVEEFGAALLRGMGWKEGSKVERPKEVKRRQNLLGLGASQLKDAEELGAWVQKADTKRLQSSSGKSSSYGRNDRPPKLSDYRREKERRDERRDERGGGSYRREREREREDYRSRDRDRDRRR
ncbi:hypothetical protein BP5796_09147 [Coleophoma crateriformis]|uniref:Pre-mRNA-splicing factor n=1 Tax=Coleophoma crateriformis TaxID=565419 RepID=A0A3D8R3G0_9HELO|nr:hypothetical protein BP5796_09147 [Coleophoma crateriformis]